MFKNFKSNYLVGVQFMFKISSITYLYLAPAHTCDSTVVPNNRIFYTNKLATNRQVVFGVDYCKCLCEAHADCQGYQVTRSQFQSR